MSDYTQAQLDAHRYDQVEDTAWWSSDLELDYQEYLRRMGFNVCAFYWSGFSCQGDGASFTGRVCNIDRFITYMTGSSGAYPLWRKAYREGLMSIHMRQNPHCRYAHECSVDVDINFDAFDTSHVMPCADPDFSLAMLQAWDAQINAEFSEFERAVERWLRAWMRRFYCDLEREHDYLTSDEGVREYLDANPEVLRDEAA